MGGSLNIVQKMRKIFECRLERENYGVVDPNSKALNVCIFKDTNENILGFRQYVPFFTNGDGNLYYEVGYFMEMLYRGDKIAFEILNVPKDFISHEDYNFEYIKAESKTFIHRKLLDNLLESAEKSFKNLKKKASLSPRSETEVTLIDYDRDLAYNCHLDIRLALDLIVDKEFKMERKDFVTLQAILEGRFIYRTVEKSYREIKEQVKEALKKNGINEALSIKKLNHILSKIRDERRIFF